MIIGVPKEIKLQEHRIGLTPDSVKALTDRNHEVLVENNGGFEAGFTNEDYLEAGAKIIKTSEEIFKKAELIVKVKEPQMNEVKMIREGQIIYTYLHLAAAKELTLGLINSKILSPLNRTWIKFGEGLGRIIAPIVMAIVYFIILTPISLIVRIFGKDLISLKFKKNLNSYWIKRDKDLGTMDKQF